MSTCMKNGRHIVKINNINQKSNKTLQRTAHHNTWFIRKGLFSIRQVKNWLNCQYFTVQRVLTLITGEHTWLPRETGALALCPPFFGSACRHTPCHPLHAAAVASVFQFSILLSQSLRRVSFCSRPNTSYTFRTYRIDTRVYMWSRYVYVYITPLCAKCMPSIISCLFTVWRERSARACLIMLECERDGVCACECVVVQFDKFPRLSSLVCRSYGLRSPPLFSRCRASHTHNLCIQATASLYIYVETHTGRFCSCRHHSEPSSSSRTRVRVILEPQSSQFILHELEKVSLDCPSMVDWQINGYSI